MSLPHLINVARGLEPPDLVIRGGTVLDVFTGALTSADVAIAGGLIAGVGDYSGPRELDATGLTLLPGFIEGHIHIESSMLTPREFARAVAPRGTTTVIADPHEICNVLGLAGMRFMLDSARDAACDFRFMAPSCVPATHLETSGYELDAAAVAELLTWDGVLGLGEMMNFPGVLAADPSVLAKLDAARCRVTDGHAPGLTGPDLHAYVAAGPRSDHECTTLAEAEEKLRAGMWIMIREGSAARNLDALAPLLSSPAAGRCLLVSDDRSPGDLLSLGHLDHSLRRAVALGTDPLHAVRAATLNPATYFRLTDRGAIAPGLRADLALVKDLTGFEVVSTIARGNLVGPAETNPGGSALQSATAVASRGSGLPPATAVASAFAAVGAVTGRGRLAVPAPSCPSHARVIGIIPGQILTESLIESLPVRDGLLQPDPARDILKLVVIERHGRGGSIGVGFVRGFGLRGGALASTVAHDSHDLIIAGATDEDILGAADYTLSMGGGQLVWSAGKPLAHLPLPIAGLMTDAPAPQVAAAQSALRGSAHTLGCPLADPFMQLSFLALPVIPALKLTDLGLVDVAAFALVPLLA